MKRFMLSLVLLATTLIYAEVTVAVAANVSYAIQPLKKAFQAMHPDIPVRVILGSSGKLTAQISHGAPYDVLLSADMKYPQKLYDDGLATSKPVVYAQGALAILSTKKRNYGAELHVLEDADIKKIAVANPKTAPYGIAAAEALKNAKLYAKLKKKFVYGESISQTVAYATTAADIGIIALSSLYSPQMAKYKEAIHWSEVDAHLYTPISQGMVILKHAKEESEVKAFYDFIVSKKAKEILKSYGYKVQ